MGGGLRRTTEKPHPLRPSAHLAPSCNTKALGCCSPSQRSYPWQPASNNGAEPRPQHGRTVAAAAKRTGRRAQGRTEEAGGQTGGLEGLEEGERDTDDTWMKELQPGGSAEIRVTLEERRGVGRGSRGEEEEEEAGELERRLRPAPATASAKNKSAKSCWWQSCPIWVFPSVIFFEAAEAFQNLCTPKSFELS